MRPGSGAVLALSLLAGLAVTGLARAEDAPQASPQTCEVPAYLLSTESLLQELNKIGRALDYEVRRERVVPVGNRLDRHDDLLPLG